MDISIIIPFKNNWFQLKRCLSFVHLQRIDYSFEILILDSSDFSIETQLSILFPKVRYIRILPENFNHGLTRNEGVKFAYGRVLVFTVQDSVPIDDMWLVKLVTPFWECDVNAICGRQESNPSDGTNPIKWYRPTDKHEFRMIHFRKGDFDYLSISEKLSCVSWDNVNAAYLKDVLVRLPFRDMMFGEDAQWCVDALKTGLKIAYNPFSAVYHDHSFNFDYSVRRYLANFYTRKKTINLDPVFPQLGIKLLLSWLLILLRTTKNPFRILYWMIINLREFQAERNAWSIWYKIGYERVEQSLVGNVPMAL